jgi:UvrB/uvrC motif
VDEDLGTILSQWPYESGKLNVRLITNSEGEARIQVRLDLGILQMHAEGRPDGQRPQGYDSLLEMYEMQFDEAGRGASADADSKASPMGGRTGEDAEPSFEEDESPDAASSASASSSSSSSGSSGGEAKYVLTPDQCQEIRDEAVQYYHRYMALMALEDYEGVVRDTTRNLRALDLCARHAQAEQDREALEQYRPYITMVRARAMASQALKDNEPKAAILAIDEGLEILKNYFASQEEPDSFDESSEVQMLRGMREALVPKLPVSQKSELRARLKRAVEHENYKLAAILRDELKMIEKEPPPPGGPVHGA